MSDTAVKWILLFYLISAVWARPSESSEENLFGNDDDSASHIDNVNEDRLNHVIDVDICWLPPVIQLPDQRRCAGFIPRWYYDSITGICKKFYWEGCWGTGNLFRNEFACLARCNRQGLQKLISESDLSAPCLQPKVVGTCHAFMRRFFFDMQIGRCTSFVYTGCGGNANNFRSYHQCDFKCNRLEQAPPTLTHLAHSMTNISIAVSTEKAVQLTKEEKCSLPPVQPGSASCSAFVPSWTFNSTAGHCHSFVYEGCGRTANLFDSLDECDSACGPEFIGEISSLPLCLQPKVIGHCRGAFPMFFFDATTGRCTRFIYGGCRGNENRFLTIEACQLACTGSNEKDVVGQLSLSGESREVDK